MSLFIRKLARALSTVFHCNRIQWVSREDGSRWVYSSLVTLARSFGILSSFVKALWVTVTLPVVHKTLYLLKKNFTERSVYVQSLTVSSIQIRCYPLLSRVLLSNPVKIACSSLLSSSLLFFITAHLLLPLLSICPVNDVTLLCRIWLAT